MEAVSAEAGAFEDGGAIRDRVRGGRGVLWHSGHAGVEMPPGHYGPAPWIALFIGVGGLGGGGLVGGGGGGL